MTTETITTVDPVLNPYQVDEQGNPIVPQAETFVQTDDIVS